MAEMEWWQVFFGLLVPLCLWYPIKSLLERLERKIKSAHEGGMLPEPVGFTRDQWNAETVQRTPGGKWVGIFELAIFYASFVSNQWPIAASWLAFKLASKWKSWTTTWQAIEPKPEDSINERSQTARAHLARTGLDHRLFIVGTSANIVAALGGYAVAKALPTFVSYAFILWSCAAKVS